VTEDLTLALAALAAEARRLEPRVVRASTRVSEDFKTVLLIETAGLTTPEASALSDALKEFRRRRDLAAAFLIVNSTGGDFVSRALSSWSP
jgi:hypothetical protein